MQRRGSLAAGALAVLALAAPTTAAAAFSLSADADQSSYATGAIASKTLRASFSGAHLKSVVYATAITPQVRTGALEALLTAPAGARVGAVVLAVGGVAMPSTRGLPVLTGSCAAHAGVPAPPPAAPVTGEWKIDTSTVPTLFGARCLGIRVDVTPPGGATPNGALSISTDVTRVEAVVGRLGGITGADLRLLNARTAAGSLFTPNPVVPVEVRTTVTALGCGADRACSGGTPPASASVREIVGGATGVHLGRIRPALYGGRVLVGGTVVRGIVASVGETVQLLQVDPKGRLVRVPGGTGRTASDGSFRISVPARRAARYAVSAMRPGDAGAPRLNTLVATAPRPTGVAAPRLTVTTSKATPAAGGTVAVTITLRAATARGLTLILRSPGARPYVQRFPGALAFRVQARRGTRFTVQLTGPGVTPSTVVVRL